MKKNADYIKQYEHLAFGLFIHWGLYSLEAKGEWLWEMYQYDKSEYQRLASKINKLDIDFDKFLKLAQASGIKYAVFTARHHDGFSMYDTNGLSTFDINLMENKLDFVEEFINACDKYQIKPFIYHTTIDWYHNEFKTSFNNYLDYLHQSVELLCKRYPQIAGFWFDGNWYDKNANWKENELYQMIRKHIVDCIIINNTGLENQGQVESQYIDVVTFEQGSLTQSTQQINNNFSHYVAKEVCQTFNDHWGYAKNDFNHKSFKEILLTALICRRYKSNFLINVGPDYQGNIMAIDQHNLLEFGRWIKQYGSCLYQGKVIEINAANEKDFMIKWNDKNYLFLYDIKSGGHVNEIAYGEKQLPTRFYNNVPIAIKKMTYCDDKTPVKFTCQNQQLTIEPCAFEYGYNTIVRVVEIE